MTTYYVYDAGSNTAPYDTWAKAAILFDTVANLMVGDDICYVASDHSEAVAASYVLDGGSQGSPTNYISLDRLTDNYESMKDGGGSIGSLAGNYDLTVEIFSIAKGLHFLIGDDLLGTTVTGVIFEDCVLEINDNFNANSTTHVSSIIFKNVEYIQRTSGQILITRSAFSWVGGSYGFGAGGVVSSNLFDFQGSSEGVSVYIEGVNFQGLDAGDYLTDVPNDRSNVRFVGCKVPSAMAGLLTGTITDPLCTAIFHNVSSADTQIDFAEYSYNGLCTDESSIYLGATQVSCEMVANANVEAGLDGLRFEIFRKYITANPTLTVELVVDELTALNDSDVWLEIYGPDDTTGALILITTTKSIDIMNPTALTSSSETWTGTGGFANEQKRKISKALSGYQAGIYKVVVVVTKNITAYIDSDVVVS